jgi:hypothetical protein
MNRNTLVSTSRALAAALVLALAGCGLAETGATATAEAEAAAEQARQGKALEEKVRHDVDAAQQSQKEAVDRAEQDAAQ